MTQTTDLASISKKRKENDMGVYIPNIEMPKSCAKCPLNSAPPNGCLIWTINDIRKDKRNESCPLVEIPTPHGRLIDRDDIYIGRWDIDSDLAEQIQNAPTILEEEK